MRAPSFGIDATRADRPAGWLTKTEREFLQGEWDPNGDGSEPTEKQKRAKRSDIRQRARHALADFALLHEYGEGELTDGILTHDTDRDIYRDAATLDHISKGVLPFVTDSLLGEGTSDVLRDAILSNPENAARLAKMIDAMQRNDMESLMETLEGLEDDLSQARQRAQDHR